MICLNACMLNFRWLRSNLQGHVTIFVEKEEEILLFPLTPPESCPFPPVIREYMQARAFKVTNVSFGVCSHTF